MYDDSDSRQMLNIRIEMLGNKKIALAFCHDGITLLFTPTGGASVLPNALKSFNLRVSTIILATAHFAKIWPDLKLSVAYKLNTMSSLKDGQQPEQLLADKGR